MNVRPENRQIDLAREPDFRLGPAEVRPSTREVVVGDARESLEPRVMQVLVALARRRGEVVSRDELTELCWNGRVVGDDAINRCIAAVRKLSLVHGGFALETIARVGFRLTETAVAPSSDIPVVEAPASALSGVRGWTIHHWRAASAVLAVLLVIVVAAWFLRPQPSPHATPLPPRLTIAVLPFTPLYSGNGAQQLGDAIAMSIADALTSSAFDVISPTKTLQFRGGAKAGAAQALHADFLIDGDVRRDGDKVFATLRLVEGSSGTIVLTSTVERAFAGADALPDEVATQLAGMGTIGKGYARAAGADARVMTGFFKAVFQLGARNDPYGANETARSIAVYAPDNAFAQSLHGIMAAHLVPWLPAERKQAMIAEARDAANRALRLEPGNADSYATLAQITPLFDWEVREGFIRRGLEVSPDCQLVQIQAIEGLQNAGRFRESVPLAGSTFKRTPYQARPLIELINALLWTGQTSDVRVFLARGRDLYPDTSWFVAKMFEATALQGDYADADRFLAEKSVQDMLGPDGSLKTFRGILEALRDRRPAAVAAVVSECGKPEGRGVEVTRTCFMTLAALGRVDDAFRLAAVLYPDLRTSPANQHRLLASELSPTAYLSVPVTAPLRADPRYRDLVERVGLLQYWKASRRPPDFCGSEKAPVCRLLK